MGSVDSICAFSQYSACSYVRDRTFFSCIAYTDCSDYVLSSSCKSAGAILQASNYDIVFACSFIAIYRIGLSIASQSNRILKNTVSISTQRNAVCTKGMCIILSMLAYDNRILFRSRYIVTHYKAVGASPFNAVIVADCIGVIIINVGRVAECAGVVTRNNMTITYCNALFSCNCIPVTKRNRPIRLFVSAYYYAGFVSFTAYIANYVSSAYRKTLLADSCIPITYRRTVVARRNIGANGFIGPQSFCINAITGRVVIGVI